MKMKNGNYNNIEDVSTSNLYKMLEMPRYQSKDYQQMIKSEIKFREMSNSWTDGSLINTNAIDNLSTEQLKQVANILGVK